MYKLTHTTFILGLPGSGKSILADKLALENPSFVRLQRPMPIDIFNSPKELNTSSFKIQMDWLKAWEDILLTADTSKKYIVNGSPLLTTYMYSSYLLRNNTEQLTELYNRYATLYKNLPYTFKKVGLLVISRTIQECYASILREGREKEQVTLSYLTELNRYFLRLLSQCHEYGYECLEHCEYTQSKTAE